MSDNVFINRDAETALLASYFQRSPSKSGFCLLQGSKGRGKSQLVEHTIQKYEIENYLRVKIQDTDRFHGEEGYFIREIGRTLDRASRTENGPRSAGGFSAQKKALAAIGAAVSTALVEYIRSKTKSDVAAEKLQKLLEGSSNNHEIIFDKISESISFIKKYIKHIFAEKRYLIAIENIQNIDSHSMSFIRDLISETGVYFVLEYTDGSNGVLSADNIRSYLGDCCHPDFVNLGPLPLKEIISYLHHDKAALVHVFESSYSTSNGNLYLLTLALRHEDMHIASSTINNVQDYIIESIDILDNDQKLLLALVVTHGGVVSRDVLEILVRKSNFLRTSNFRYRDLSAIARPMVGKKGLLAINDQEFRLEHDSASIAIMEHPRCQKYISIANHEWLSLYYDIRKTETDFLLPLSEILGWELYFRAHTGEVSGFADALSCVYTLCLKSRTPRRTIHFAESIRSRVCRSNGYSKDILKNIDKMICKIFYRLSWFGDVIRYSSPEPEDTLVFLLHTTALTLEGRHAEALTLLDRVEQMYPQKSDIHLGAKLVRIANLRSSNRYDECAELWWELYRQEYYKDSRLEGMFLKCADMALINCPKERNDFLREACTRFSEDGDILQGIAAHIALSQYFGYDGDLDAAYHELGIARSLAEPVMDRHYMIENNDAVISLYRKSPSHKDLERLELAFDLCNNHFDRAIILNNLVIYFAITGSLEDVDRIGVALEELIDMCPNMDVDIKRCSYYNMSMACKHKSTSEFYMKKARSVEILSDHEFWNSRLNGANYSGYNFKLTIEFYPIFLSSWHLDFDSVLGN